MSVIKLGNAQVLGERDEQQDAFGYNDVENGDFARHGGVVAVVCDGIGGHAHGAEASEKAVQVFLQAYQAKLKLKRTKIPHALFFALRAANRAVRQFARDRGVYGNCGTTLVAAVLHPPSRALYWISAGDSRLYLLRGKQWVQLTSDGNYASQRIKQIARGTVSGITPKLEANPNVITSFLGVHKLAEVDHSIRPFILQEGDWLVLCTDGMFNGLSSEELVNGLYGEPQAACNRLARLLIAKGLKNQDNSTIVAMGYQLEDPPLSFLRPTSPAKQYLWLGFAVVLSVSLLVGAIWLGSKASKESQVVVEPPPTELLIQPELEIVQPTPESEPPTN